MNDTNQQIGNDSAENVEEVGVDTGGIGELGEPATVYPVPDDKHIGVHTSGGTSPEATDQGDEQAKAVWGTPDDVNEVFDDESEDGSSL